MSESILSESIEDFGFPITLAFSKDGRAYLSERMTGKLWRVDHDNFRLVKAFPIVSLLGHHETGLLGIALDPDFEKNSLIYAFYTKGTTEDYKNRVVRIKDDGSNEQVLVDNLPAGLIHNGGILAFGQDKTLYIGIGVQNEIKEKAQDLNWLGGKILRVNPDGSIPKDNPFHNSMVYSYGHRNIFGLAVHPKTGKLYAVDVGPDHDDEIDIIEKGGNYGWPEVMGFSKDSKYVNPIKSYPEVITPTQMVFAGDDLYFGSYNEGTVHKLTLAGENFDQVKKDEIVYKGEPYGVIGVFHSPDNKFYVTLPNAVKQFNPKT